MRTARVLCRLLLGFGFKSAEFLLGRPPAMLDPGFLGWLFICFLKKHSASKRSKKGKECSWMTWGRTKIASH